MKIKFDRKKFVKALNIGSSYTKNSKVHPILSCLKITIKGDKCWIMSYDECNAIKTFCDIVESDGDFIFCIPADDFKKHLELLFEDYVTISVDNENLRASISTTSSLMEFPLQDAQSYPVVKQDQWKEHIQLSCDTLLYWINKSSPFLIDDEMYLSKSSINLRIINNEIHVYASDNQRIYSDYCECEDSRDIFIPIDKTSFSGLVAAFKAHPNQYVKISNGERSVMYVFDDGLMILARKREYKMLDYASLMAFKEKARIRLNKEYMLDVLRRSVTVHEVIKSGVSTFEFKPDKIIITTEGLLNEKRYTEVIEVETGIEYTQKYNTWHMFQTISSINSEDIFLCPSGERSLLKIINTDNETEIAGNCPFY